MIRANIDVMIEQKEKELEEVRADIFRLDAIINSLKEQQKKLLDKDSELYYEIQELTEELPDYI